MPCDIRRLIPLVNCGATREVLYWGTDENLICFTYINSLCSFILIFSKGNEDLLRSIKTNQFSMTQLKIF